VRLLESGIYQRRPQPGGWIFHSDRGSQYAGEDFRVVINKHGILASMSRKGNCGAWLAALV
jgi:transposase InsO family protein